MQMIFIYSIVIRADEDFLKPRGYFVDRKVSVFEICAFCQEVLRRVCSKCGYHRRNLYFSILLREGEP